MITLDCRPAQSSHKGPSTGKREAEGEARGRVEAAPLTLKRGAGALSQGMKVASRN